MTRATSQALFVTTVATLTALSHAPFIGSGIGMDEGGYAYIAWRWSAGAKLYTDAWVDRPQALMILYRAVDAVSLDPRAIRVVAAICSFVTALAIAASARRLAGSRAAIIASLVYAVVSAAPRIEGFTLNGETPAACWSALAVALALRARSHDASRAAMLSGLCSVLAVATKQSAFDGLVITAALLLRGGTRPRLGWIVGVCAALAALVAQGIADGWRAYWFAIAGYKLSAHSGPHRPLTTQAHRFVHTSQALWHDERTLIIFALVLLCLTLRGSRRPPVLPLAWLAVATVGVTVGGQYWAHYYVELLPPLVLSAAVAIASTRSRFARIVGVALAIVPAGLESTLLVVGADSARWRPIPYAGRGASDARLAELIRAHTAPGSTLFVLGGDPAMYYLARRRAVVRYLWPAQFSDLAAARTETQGALAGTVLPGAVATFMGAGQIAAIPGRLEVLERRYDRAGCLSESPDRCVYILRSPTVRQLRSLRPGLGRSSAARASFAVHRLRGH